ncbi:phage major capsid protein [Pimelobacter simplex]|uniref:phage major capsid protein n=1 Tax=Nocardioides simplex TaxID=2045 RepID=UPI00214F843F|nr:phage major capsid protein [Pimelobacter simplex]UUW87406.1 phage major capsid protein [Pimelobacter simplex]UUW96911.1 phage major capsid protein [Pimelobacter simplex]
MTATIPEFPALKEARGKLVAKQDELGSIFAEAGPDLDLSKVKSIPGAADTKAVAEHIRSLNDECTDLAKDVDDLAAVHKAAESSAGRGTRGGGVEPGAGQTGIPGAETTKSLGEMFTESDAFKTKGRSADLDMELKTLLSRSAGWAPETTRGPRVVDFATPAPQILDLIPTTPTSQAAVKYMEETTYTNAAAERAEGGPYAEAALALTERTSVVQSIGVWLPVTDEQLEDEPRVRAYIDNRLPFMVRQRLGSQVLVGNGTDPNLRGILNVAGIQTQAKGTDPVPDAVYKAMTKVRVTGQALPNAFVAHPNDWQDVRLLRTADGIYIWGSPSEVGPERIWGLQVVQEAALTENTGLVGDFANYSELAVRRGVEVQVTNAHADFFVNGKQAIRASLRAALVIYRPAAFATVTGI